MGYNGVIEALVGVVFLPVQFIYARSANRPLSPDGGRVCLQILAIPAHRL
jgi:hypothetical protein